MDTHLLNQIIDRYFTSTFTVNRIMNSLITDRMPQNLTADQYCILKYIGEQQNCTSSELSEVFLVGKSSITAMVNRLKDKNLLTRTPDEKDRRVIYLSLTPEGERLAVGLKETIEDLLRKYMVHFEEGEALAFIKTFEKLERLLSEDEGGTNTR
ncbi:MarR family transcriptional regulator [Paenibacillus swuensis]|uniref:MarR family transcriptional regulator n=1 Tax=Paenibacillus swuensis TaxID=1178515 RepID=A0A172THR4_9BACL|nr:MarR family transcriptional regulator [Paenibacillus swuensis]ANE46581.1 MarR family transcriptional regulator [Paenibacillus swuensis]